MRASALALRLAVAVLPTLACAPAPARVAPSLAPGNDLAGTPSPRPVSGAPLAPLVGEYAVVWDAAAGELRVAAHFTASAGGTFTLERGAETFARTIEASADRDGAPWSPVTRRGRQFDAPPCASAACRLRYRFALRAAAKKLDDLDSASEESDVIEAPPSSWLLAPVKPAAQAQRLRFRMTAPATSQFVTGVFRSVEAPDAWDITVEDLWTSPYSAFGPLRVRSIPVKGGAVQLAIGPGNTAVSEDDIAQWTEAAGRCVSGYFGSFPMPGALVLLSVARGQYVGSGRTLSGGGGTVFVRVGERASAKAYREDWVLVHEMIHLTFPSVPREQDWAEEGIATYVEPFARVRAGLLSEDDAWVGLVEGLPNGLPGPGDRGLDHTHTWGRIYWGGALFWFLADVEIHKRTHNKMGLEHALRGINAAGGTNATRWPLAEVLATGDKAVGVPVLTELYAAMGASPHPVDLAPLIKSLGVDVSHGFAHFDDQAPLADIRRAIARGMDAATAPPAAAGGAHGP